MSDTNPWYKDSIEGFISKDMQDILINHSKIPPSDLVKHLYTVRDKMWEIDNFPCIGYWAFLTTNVQSVPGYAHVLDKAKHGGQILDLGCCVGQELRKLVADGAPSDKLYGADLKPDYWPLGYELFADRSSFKGQFLQVDVFEKNSQLYTDIPPNSFDVVIMCYFLHLFTYEKQREVASNVIEKLLRVEKGSIICGAVIGSKDTTKEQDELSSIMKGRFKGRYSHDKDRMTQFWKEVGNQFKLELEIHVQEEEMPELLAKEDKWKEVHYLRFSVQIV